MNFGGKIRRNGLVGDGMSLGVSFEVSKDYDRVSLSPSLLPFLLPVDPDITLSATASVPQPSASHHADPDPLTL